MLSLPGRPGRAAAPISQRRTKQSKAGLSRVRGLVRRELLSQAGSDGLDAFDHQVYESLELRLRLLQTRAALVQSVYFLVRDERLALQFLDLSRQSRDLA